MTGEPSTCGRAPCCCGALCAECSPWGGPPSCQACPEPPPWGQQSAAWCMGHGHGPHGSLPASECRLCQLCCLNRCCRRDKYKVKEKRIVFELRGFTMLLSNIPTGTGHCKTDILSGLTHTWASGASARAKQGAFAVASVPLSWRQLKVKFLGMISSDCLAPSWMCVRPPKPCSVNNNLF